MENSNNKSSTLFDDWAKEYDKDVDSTDKLNVYPFAGYNINKNVIIDNIKNNEASSILEMGIGTGAITEELYNTGYNITGVDFSEEMIYHAKIKMPKAAFHKATFNDSLEILERKVFDWIIFSYSIHHLSYDEQYSLILRLLDKLSTNGKIIIADVMTLNSEKMDTLKDVYEGSWDDEENYPIYNKYLDELRSLYSIEINLVSHCAGYMILTKK